MKAKSLFMATAVMLLFAACSNENDFKEVYIPDEGEIQFVMLHPGQTRATETSFEENDSIGVFVTESDAELQLAGNEVNNEPFTYNGTTWTSLRKVYWNSGLHNVYAFYPYSRTVNDVENYSFSVNSDQSTHTGYTRSDFLWASAKGVEGSNEPVAMQFSHILSNVVVLLEKGENYEGNLPADAEVYIHSLIRDATIDLSIGDAAKDNYAAASTIRCLKVSNSEYKAIVVPQNITSRRPLVEIIVDNVSYLMEGKISLKPGYKHTVTVTLDKNPDNIKIEIGGSVGGWN